MPQELNLRRLRYFIAVADRLNFTAAAGHLHVAQQAVSREVRLLEDDVGVALFDRTTRRVSLTPAGARLLDRARDLLALHDDIRDEVVGRHHQPLVVDVVGDHLTPHLVVQAARARSAEPRIVIRTGGGLAGALPQLLAGGTDVGFGYADPAALPGRLAHRLIRLEPLGLLLPAGHPLAAVERIGLARLRGLTVDVSSGNPNATEWTALGTALLAAFGGHPSPPHPHVVGPDETGRHLQADNVPILTHTTAPAVPGAVVRPLVDPVPLYPWRMLWRRDLRHAALGALHDAADRLAADHDWLGLPPAAWQPGSAGSVGVAVVGATETPTEPGP